MSRRELGLLGMGALALGALGADSAVTTAQADMVDRPARLVSRVAFMQVVAHPDDDLYFMNPDIADSVRTGGEVTTVVLTAAEAGGGAPFAAARQHGLRSAYARMAGADDDAPWRRSVLVTRGGEAELCELESDPRVRLVFLDISMGSYTGSTPGDENHTPLAALYRGTLTTRPVLQPSESAITAGVYTRDQLVGTLTDLMDRFQPTVVRTMDPDPERRGVGPRERAWLTDSGVHTDNEDHTATAWFTYAAYADHRARRGPSAVRLDAYVGYGNARWRHNLGGSSGREKLRLLGVYGWADRRKCGDPVGCGDRTVGGDAARPGWSQSTNLRHVGTTDWLRLGPDGRLRAFAAVGGQAVMWTETAPGSGDFTPGAGIGTENGINGSGSRSDNRIGSGIGSSGIGSGIGKDQNTAFSLTPHLVVAVAPDHRAQLVGLRTTSDPDRGTWSQEVVVAGERPDGGFTPWTGLGTPIGAETKDCADVGCPTAVVDGRGVLHVFVRNADMSVSWRCRDLNMPGAAWTEWQDIGGHQVRDGLTAAVTQAGDVELHAVGHVLWTWRIGSSGGPLLSHAALPPMGDPPTVHTMRGGGALLAARAADTGVLSVMSRSAGGDWRPQRGTLGGQGGFGVVAIQPHAGGVFLAQRGRRGLVEVVWQPEVGAAGGVRRWHSGPGPILRPSLAVDAHGRVVAGAVGPDGALYTARIDVRDVPRTLRWQAAALA
ncbi:PIG-L family deacetylase [Catenulispora sp. MAP12-49]|uniref:PIG-L family deacetylase n=1 Tax=Catenulispora sp. MAP12-49 TaxID=3156302 RepID=UPI003516E552